MILLKFKKFYRSHDMATKLLEFSVFVILGVIMLLFSYVYVSWNNFTTAVKKEVAIEKTKTVDVKNIKNY